MAKTNQCAGCRKCVQGDFGELDDTAASGARFMGTLGRGTGGSMDANINECPCMFCGHRLGVHPRLGVGLQAALPSRHALPAR